MKNDKFSIYVSIHLLFWGMGWENLLYCIIYCLLTFENLSFFKEIRGTAVTEMNFIAALAHQHSVSRADGREEFNSQDFEQVWKQSKAKCRAIVVDNISNNATLIDEYGKT